MDGTKHEAKRQTDDEAGQTPECMDCGKALGEESVGTGICMDCFMADDEASAEPAKPAVELTVPLIPGKSKEQSLAAHLLQPSLQAGLTVWQWSSGIAGDLDPISVINELERQTAGLSAADGLTRCEAVLIAQVHTLDAVANNLFRRAQTAQLMPHLEIYVRLGLKAQAQCRVTVSALAEIKRPRQTAFVQQANIAHGPQQVNNGLSDANDKEQRRQSVRDAWTADRRAWQASLCSEWKPWRKRVTHGLSSQNMRAELAAIRRLIEASRRVVSFHGACASTQI